MVRGSLSVVRSRWHVCFLCALLVGCSTQHDHICQALMKDSGLPAEQAALAGTYQVGCPDVLAIEAADRPDLQGLYEVQANGCIDLGDLGGVRVEGLTPAEIASQVRDLAGLVGIQVRVSQYRSQSVYLFGQVTGEQRAVAYRGPEKVTELLRRAGGVTLGGDIDEIRLVRQSGTPGAQPKVHQVDLRAILLEKNSRTDVTVQPYDQIYVPETRRFRISKCVHPLVLKVARILTNRREPAKPAGGEAAAAP